MAPALLTRTSSRGRRSRTTAASRRTDLCEARWAGTTSPLAAPPPAALILATAWSARASFRATDADLGPQPGQRLGSGQSDPVGAAGDQDLLRPDTRPFSHLSSITGRGW